MILKSRRAGPLFDWRLCLEHDPGKAGGGSSETIMLKQMNQSAMAT
jgi:hypothetical protein